MKIKAADVLGRKVYRWKVLDYSDCGHLDRINRMAEIEQAAYDFAYDVLADFDMPSAPNLSVGNLRGFEGSKPIEEVTGYIVVNATFSAWSGHVIRMAMPIPVYKGEFLRPSVIIVNNKRIPFSQSALDRLVGSTESVRMTVDNPYSPDLRYQHIEDTKRGLFSAPDPPMGVENEVILGR